jgi:hypothetical protein
MRELFLESTLTVHLSFDNGHVLTNNKLLVVGAAYKTGVDLCGEAFS